MGLGDLFNVLFSSLDRMVRDAERKTYNDLRSQASNYDGSSDAKLRFNQSMENYEKISNMRGQLDSMAGRSSARYDARENDADRFYNQAKSNISQPTAKRRF